MFGPLTVRVDGVPVADAPWQRRGPRQLLTLLALAPRLQLHREQLIERLWPDSSPAAGLNNFNKAVFQLRHGLESGLSDGAASRFVTREGAITRLTAPGGVSVDLDLFERRVEEVLKNRSLTDLSALGEQCQVELLDADRYEPWAVPHRERFERRRVELRRALAEALERAGRRDESAATWKAMVDADPSDENAHRQLMRLYADTGQRQKALAQYQACAESIRELLGLDPERTTVDLHRAILSGSPASPAGAPEASPKPPVGGPRSDVRALAVLPFENATGNPTLDYLCDGIAHSLTSALAQVGGVRVMARSTVSRVTRSATDDPLERGRLLGIDALITGEVQQWSDRVMVGIELVDVADGALLWSERLEGDPAQVFDLQASMSRGIAEQLRLELTHPRRMRAYEQPTSNAAAYQHYLLGRHHWDKRTGRSLAAAIDSFQRAIHADAEFALAHAGLADCYNLQSLYALVAPTEAMPKARRAAERALAIDRSLAEAHTSLGFYQGAYAWNADAAQASFRTAAALHPNYAVTHQWSHMFDTARGAFDAAREHIDTARRLDPLSPMFHCETAWGRYLARRVDEANAALTRAFEIAADFPMTHYVAGLVALLEDAPARAIDSFERALMLMSDAPFPLGIATLGHACARSGRHADARAQAERLDTLSRTAYIPAYTRALIDTALGDTDAGLDALEAAHDERCDRLVFIGVEPMLDALRATPRFRALEQSIERGSARE